MTFRHIRVFLAVCDNQNNLTQAARQLFITQPSVSVAIREIEQEYGLQLFDRLGKKLYLTQEGALFLQYARRLDGVLHDMEMNLRHPGRQHLLRVGASVTIGSYFLPGYLEAFHRQHPEVEVRVRIEPSQTLEEELLRSELDFALLERPVHSPMLLREPYQEDHLVVITPNRPPYTEMKTMSQEQLRHERLLLRDQGSGPRDLIDLVTAQAGFQLEPVWEGTSIIALINGVKCGLGISIQPFQLVRPEAEAGHLLIMKVDGMDFLRTFDLVVHKDKVLSTPMADFFELCRHFPGTESPCPQTS